MRRNLRRARRVYRSLRRRRHAYEIFIRRVGPRLPCHLTTTAIAPVLCSVADGPVAAMMVVATCYADGRTDLRSAQCDTDVQYRVMTSSVLHGVMRMLGLLTSAEVRDLLPPCILFISPYQCIRWCHVRHFHV